MTSDNHNYDGIEELDNPLPNWWLYIFIGTIIFAFVYFLHYSSHSGPTLTEEFEADMKLLPQVVEKAWSEDDLSSLFGASESLANGKVVFAAKCVACHGAEGQGVIGPNLTDRFWIRGTGQRKDILTSIRKGIVQNGMPPWEGVLSDNETIHVAAYVFSLKGTNPANPKAPQGQEIK